MDEEDRSGTAIKRERRGNMRGQRGRWEGVREAGTLAA